jgi:signal transduction histidine kinase
MGFDVREVSGGLLHLKDAVRTLIAGTPLPGTASAAAMLADLDVYIRLAVMEFGGLYATGMRAALEAEKRRTAQLLEAVEGVGQTLEIGTVMERVTFFIRSALQASWCSIFTEDESSSLFHRRRSTGVLDSNAARTALKRAVDPTAGWLSTLLAGREHITYQGPEVCPLFGALTCDSLGIASALVLPIIVRDRPLAFVLATTSEGMPPPNRDQASLATGISNAVGPALENALLYAELRRNLSETCSVQEISSALLEEFALTKMLDLVCRQSLRLTGAGGAAVLLNREEGGFQPVVSVGDQSERSSQSLFDTMPWSRSGAPVEPVVFNDLPTPSTAGTRSSGSLIAAPLRVAGKVEGVLQLVNKRKSFDEDDIRLATRIADLAAIAIEHARLHSHRERMVILEERQRVARDLHDSVTQSLYSVTMFAETAARLVKKNDVVAAADTLRDLKEISQRALWEMRLLLFELHPHELKEQGLATALQSRLEMVEMRAGLKTDFDCQSMHRLPDQVEQALYRIAQEALNNAIKHARASHVRLKLKLSHSVVRLECEDNGVGFDLGTGRKKGGMGLSGMDKRAVSVGGKLTIASRPGRGTQIVATIPVAEPKSPERGQPRGVEVATV